MNILDSDLDFTIDGPEPRLSIKTSIPAHSDIRRNWEIGRPCISFGQHNSSIMPPSGNARFLCAFDPHDEVLMDNLG